MSEFLRAAELANMKQVQNAEFYVKVMQRWISGGESLLERDMAKMRAIFTARKTSWNALDGMKRGYNVFTQFLVKTEPPVIEERGEGEARSGL
jgi:hypothetical protein